MKKYFTPATMVALFFAIMFLIANSLTAQTVPETSPELTEKEWEVIQEAYNIHESTESLLNEFKTLHTLVEIKNSLEDLEEWMIYDIQSSSIDPKLGDTYVVQFRELQDKLCLLYTSPSPRD